MIVDRRVPRAFAASLLAAVAALGGLVACEPAPPAKPVIQFRGSTALVVADDGSVSFTLACTGAKPCKGSTRIRAAGLDGPAGPYALAAGQARAYAVKLSAAQLAAVAPCATAQGQVRIKEDAPAAFATRVVAVTVQRPAPPVVETPTSVAYRERNWTPTTGDTCTAAFHRSFSVVGPDGKLYPTWHPPTAVDPATGQTCSFGHEHGDDPATSDIYAWATDFLDATPATSRGIPFGYVSEALGTYAAAHDNVTRQEDNVGHKIIVANDVRQVVASPRGYLRDAEGEIVTCDVLAKVHQGTHSGDALINNAHELLYAARCTDGTEIISSTLTRFGNANQFNRSCNREMVSTTGSNLPDGNGGSRVIPDRYCIDRDVLVPPNQNSSIWALYEVWQSANDLTTVDGRSLASFDPWFGVRNPSRAHAGGINSSILDFCGITDLTDAVDGGRANGYPFDEVIELEQETGTQLTKNDPASPFDGAQRDFYLHTTKVTNAGGPTTWFTNPYGDEGVPTAGPGLVRQHLSSTDNAAWPNLERRSFNLEKDYGNANGVHAPN
ncbi:hypothetical protein BH10ACT1_BH10ACT1_19630 [soil metagenome]